MHCFMFCVYKTINLSFQKQEGGCKGGKTKQYEKGSSERTVCLDFIYHEAANGPNVQIC